MVIAGGMDAVVSAYPWACSIFRVCGLPRIVLFHQRGLLSPLNYEGLAGSSFVFIQRGHCRNGQLSSELLDWAVLASGLALLFAYPGGLDILFRSILHRHLFQKRPAVGRIWSGKLPSPEAPLGSHVVIRRRLGQAKAHIPVPAMHCAAVGAQRGERKDLSPTRPCGRLLQNVALGVPI
jgi:hypothetical protein